MLCSTRSATSRDDHHPADKTRDVSNHRRLLLSPLWLLVALVSTLGLNVTSAAAAGGLETRVRAFDHPTATAVEQPSSETAGGVGCVRPVSVGRASGSCVATNTAKGLGDDFTRALDDIDNGLPRPNVRNPKPFANDGRGGTTRLPVADGAGNPVSYVEHTVSPRPPGGSLDGSRIVVGSDGTVWATTDHFGTWTQVR